MINKIKATIYEFISFFKNLLRKPVQPVKYRENSNRIACSHESLELISSSSVVFHLKTDTIDGYFYECRPHTPIHAYVTSFVEDYYSLIYVESPFNEIDKKLVLTSINDPENLNKFITMGIKFYNANTPCMEFLRTGNGKAIGLNTNECDDEQIKRLQRFVGEYAWCQLNSYKVNNNLRINDLQTHETNIALASQEVANLLKLDYLIPKAEYVRLSIDNNEELFGLFVQKASGCSILPYSSEERKAKITPYLQRDLTLLNFLDVITYEQDHSPNNYNVIMNNDGYVVGVCSFDNKSIGAFALRNNINFSTFKNCSPFVDQKGLINRPHLSKSIIEHIETLTFNHLFSTLKWLLTPTQILFTWNRIKRLKKAVRKTIKQNKNFVINDTDWSESTLEHELTGDYGKTYLISFYSNVFLY